MTDKEKIRIEIKQRIASLERNVGNGIGIDGQIDAYYSLLEFVDSMKEEPVSEDLEEAALRANIILGDIKPKEFLDEYPYDPIGYRKFIEGAKWQKQQMMKMAVDGVVCFGSKGVYVESDWLGTTDVETYGDNGSKVRIIVLKED